MPLTCEEWGQLRPYIEQAKALSSMALGHRAADAGEPVPLEGDDLDVLMTATDRALCDIEAVADGLCDFGDLSQ